MLSHGNLVAGVKSLGSIAEVSCQPIKNDDVYIGYLPLAHVLELLAESCMLFLGIGIGYSSPNSLTDTSTMIMPGILPRDVTTGATGATAVASRFSDTLTLFQPRGADSAHHSRGRI